MYLFHFLLPSPLFPLGKDYIQPLQMNKNGFHHFSLVATHAAPSVNVAAHFLLLFKMPVTKLLLHCAIQVVTPQECTALHWMAQC